METALAELQHTLNIFSHTRRDYCTVISRIGTSRPNSSDVAAENSGNVRTSCQAMAGHEFKTDIL
jgi:hypothetical protein